MEDIVDEKDTQKVKVTNQNYSPIAQSVERLTVNQNVRGSSPRRGAKQIAGVSIMDNTIAF